MLSDFAKGSHQAANTSCTKSVYTIRIASFFSSGRGPFKAKPFLCHGIKRQAKENKTNSRAMPHGVFAKAKCQALTSALAQSKSIERDGTTSKSNSGTRKAIQPRHFIWSFLLRQRSIFGRHAGLKLPNPSCFKNCPPS